MENKILNEAIKPYQMRSIKPRNLIFLKNSPTELFLYNEGSFKTYLDKGDNFNKEILEKLIKLPQNTLFAPAQSYDKIIEEHQKALRNSTRALSIGEIEQNILSSLNLMTINLEHLYNDPTNDDILTLQAQSARNVCQFLLKNKQHIQEMYLKFSKQNFYYIHLQPLLSSLILIGFLTKTALFNEKEIEGLFITSYFKDIGMGLVPAEKFETAQLDQKTIKIFKEHPIYSRKILDGRIPLNQTFHEIITNHHVIDHLNENENSEKIIDVETLLVSSCDILAALITKRPYRKEFELYQALQIIKKRMGKQYYQEFKLMIQFSKSFFSKDS